MSVILQKYFWALSFFMMTAVAALAADGIRAVLVWKLDSLPGTARVVAAGAASDRPARAEDEMDAVIRGNLFNAGLRGQGVGNFKIPSAAETAPTLFRGELVGTIAGVNTPSYAVIEDSESHEQGLFGVGDMLDSTTRVVSVAPERVILQRGSERIELKTVSPETLESPGTGGIRKAGENRWVVDQTLAQASLGDMNRLLTQAQIVPAFSGGRPDGFRVASIASGSFFDQIGLQNNDILQRINGVEIKDPDSFIRVFAQLKDETHISLDLKRGGRKQTFQYDIH